MLKLAPLFLILAVVFGLYALSATAVMPKVLFFSSVVVLFLSLLGKKRTA